MAFVLRTDKMSSPHYFAGAVQAPVSTCICITKTIFDAWFFETKNEAAELLEDLGDDWQVSETSGPIKVMQ